MPAVHTIHCLKTCADCAREFECGVLNAALTLLEKHQSVLGDIECRQMYEAFADKVKAQGYGYPDSPVHCKMQHEKQRVRGLVEEAVGLLKIFTDRLCLGHRSPEPEAV